VILADPYLLDDAESIELADTSGVVRDVAGAPAQLREAAFIAAEVDLSDLRDGPRPRAVVVVGAGDGGIAGETLAALVSPTSPVPVVVVRGARLPGWVGAADLVVGVSGSGTTQTTLTTVEEAVRRGVPVVGVGAPGSPLLELVLSGRGVVFGVAGGRGDSSGLWALAAPVLVLAQAIGISRLPAADLDGAAEVLDSWTERCRPSKEGFLNVGKELALALADRQPLLWATSQLAGVAAHRGASQLASRAAVPALHATLTNAELDQVALLDDPTAAERLAVVLLRHDDEQPAVADRAAALRDLAAERGVPVHELQAEGTGGLSALASLVAPLDFASAYAALARGLDPGRAGVIGELSIRSTR